jgi:hypothetical protein
MKHHPQAEKQTPEPPPPKLEPKPIVDTPTAVVAGQPCLGCGDISGMTHEEKMLKAYEMAKQKLPDAIREELPDPAVFVGMMAVVGGILAVATFATGGLAAVAAGMLIGLAIVGAALTGYEIGQVLNGLYGFFDKTRCDKAQTEADLDAAANDLAGAFAKGGVAGVMAILTGLLGKAGGKIAKKIKIKKSADHYLDWAKKNPGEKWAKNLPRKTRKAMRNFLRGKKLKNGETYGQSVKDLDLRGKTPKQLEDELLKKGFKKHEGVITDSKTGQPVLKPDGTPARQDFYTHPDGGMVRVKPDGHPGSKFRADPHASKSVRNPPDGDHTKFEQEGFKVDNDGNAHPKWDKDGNNPYPRDSKAAKDFADNRAEAVHTYLD